MRLLAIDPGYDRCGLAVLEKTTSGEKLIFSTCLTTRNGDEYATRLVAIGQAVKKQLETWQPEIVALEKLFFSANQKTATKISEVRGVLIYLATEARAQVLEFTPLEIKQTVTGFGQANKKQIMEMIPRLIKLETVPKYDDEYDAIAVGLTALALYPQLARQSIAK